MDTLVLRNISHKNSGSYISAFFFEIKRLFSVEMDINRAPIAQTGFDGSKAFFEASDPRHWLLEFETVDIFQKSIKKIEHGYLGETTSCLHIDINISVVYMELQDVGVIYGHSSLVANLSLEIGVVYIGFLFCSLF